LDRRFGIPQTAIIVNGTNFINQEMAIFAVDWNFELITSASHNQQSNGERESAVKIVKPFLVCTTALANNPNKIGSPD
jgi:hypothetical protein